MEGATQPRPSSPRFGEVWTRINGQHRGEKVRVVWTGTTALSIQPLARNHGGGGKNNWKGKMLMAPFLRDFRKVT